MSIYVIIVIKRFSITKHFRSFFFSLEKFKGVYSIQDRLRQNLTNSRVFHTLIDSLILHRVYEFKKVRFLKKFYQISWRF